MRSNAAIKHQIRLVVKASGHDYVGRSNAPNSLSIWIHYLKGIQIHDSFQPKSCTATIAGGAVTVGGGQQMVDILEALAPLNRTIVGGSSKSVGVSGHMTSGGHSILSSTYGLAADQALEMEIVTPQGELVTANECQNQDLFWAMRGVRFSKDQFLRSVLLTRAYLGRRFYVWRHNISDCQNNPKPANDNPHLWNCDSQS